MVLFAPLHVCLCQWGHTCAGEVGVAVVCLQHSLVSADWSCTALAGFLPCWSRTCRSRSQLQRSCLRTPLQRYSSSVLACPLQIHHGNGTQKVFWEDERVLFVSLHRRDKDFYPQVCAAGADAGGSGGV